MKIINVSKRSLTIIAVLVPLLGLLAYVALRSGPLAPVGVTVVSVKNKALRPAIFGVGHVEAQTAHRIGPTAPGRLLRLNVDVGDEVKQGQLLGEMDAVDNDDRLRSQEAAVRRSAAMIAEAEARYGHANAQATRYEKLYAEKASSEEMLLARRQDLQVAKAQLAAAREEQAKATSDLQALRSHRASLRLTSPINGIVTMREAEPGTAVVSGQSVVEVIDPKSLWINTRFDQVSVYGLAVGQPAHIALRSRRGQMLEGRVRRTEWRADSVTEEALAKISLNDVPQQLPPIGERAEVTVYLPALPEGPVIPNAAVQRQGKQVGVWVAQGDRVQFLPIKLGRVDLEGNVQVLDGLKLDDMVVLYSEKSLSEQSRIHIAEHLPGVPS